MNYLKIRWIHENKNNPVLLLDELDDDRYEVSKIEVFPDGRLGFASSDQSSDETVLGEKPVPLAADISSDPQFVLEISSPEEFEKIWKLAIVGARS